jgi:hypothetical protein
VRLALPLAAVLLASSVRATKPAPVTSFPPEWPHACPFRLSRELLLAATSRIVIVVDVPRGFAPKSDALDSLASLAARYGEREARWVRLGDPGAPRVVWSTPRSPSDAPVKFRPVRTDSGSGVVRLSQDQVDLARIFGEVPACPDGALPSDTSFVFVRYLGEWGSSYGAYSAGTTDASCGGREVPILYLAQGRIDRGRPPTFSQSFLERRALAHEYGHALGLGSNPAHGHWLRTTPHSIGPHCVNRECAVAIPSAKALLKGQMLDYCADCRRDVQQARSHWRSGATFAEVRRIPPPDPAAHVARLKPYNFREGGDADRLVGYGKAVMPALLTRVPELPGGSEVSPRAYAATLGLRIIDAEDRKRRGLEDDATPIHPTKDVSRELLVWWSAEGERFLAGDDWLLPDLSPRP